MPRTRTGADYARYWAREWQLGNPAAKAVLLALSNYADEYGRSFPGLVTLSRDTDLSQDTILRRLRWLDEIGVIALRKRWIGPDGRENFDGKGRITSYEITFLFEADRALIEARLDGEENSTEFSSRHDREQNDEISSRHDREQNPVSSRLAHDLHTKCDPPYIESELGTMKDSPQPPASAGGGHEIDADLEADITEFAQAYPAPITNMPKLRAVMGALKADERKRVILGATGYADFVRECERRGKQRAVKDADRWVTQGMWEGYIAAGERTQAARAIRQVTVESSEGKAYATLCKVADVSPFESRGAFTLAQALSPQALALVHAPPEPSWHFLTAAEHPKQVKAWDEFLARELAGKRRPKLIRRRFWPCINRLDEGVAVPWFWPPNKDGRIYQSQNPSEDIAREFLQSTGG